VILFSDILTPLSGMNIPFDIVKGRGPVIFDPIHTDAQVNQVREFVPEESVPYVGEALTILRKEVRLVLCSVAFLHLFILHLTSFLYLKHVCFVQYHKTGNLYFI